MHTYSYARTHLHKHAHTHMRAHTRTNTHKSCLTKHRSGQHTQWTTTGYIINHSWLDIQHVHNIPRHNASSVLRRHVTLRVPCCTKCRIILVRSIIGCGKGTFAHPVASNWSHTAPHRYRHIQRPRHTNIDNDDTTTTDIERIPYTIGGDINSVSQKNLCM